MKQFAKPLRDADRRTLASVFGGLFLLTIYLYQGHHTVFTRHFGTFLEGGDFADWAAHCYQFAAAFLLMAVIPALWIRFGLKECVRDNGLVLGDWRFGLKFVVIAIVVLTIPLFLGAGSPEMQAEYPLAQEAGRSVALFVAWELCYLVYYVSWEFFFRGFWQIGLSRAMGVFAALALQTTASTLMHIGKPESETLFTIVGGIVAGLVAVRTRSILYILLVHWYVGMATDLFCIIRAG